MCLTLDETIQKICKIISKQNLNAGDSVAHLLKDVWMPNDLFHAALKMVPRQQLEQLRSTYLFPEFARDVPPVVVTPGVVTVYPCHAFMKGIGMFRTPMRENQLNMSVELVELDIWHPVLYYTARIGDGIPYNIMEALIIMCVSAMAMGRRCWDEDDPEVLINLSKMGGGPVGPKTSFTIMTPSYPPVFLPVDLVAKSTDILVLKGCEKITCRVYPLSGDFYEFHHSLADLLAIPGYSYVRDGDLMVSAEESTTFGFFHAGSGYKKYIDHFATVIKNEHHGSHTHWNAANNLIDVGGDGSYYVYAPVQLDPNISGYEALSGSIVDCHRIRKRHYSANHPYTDLHSKKARTRTVSSFKMCLWYHPSARFHPRRLTTEYNNLFGQLETGLALGN